MPARRFSPARRAKDVGRPWLETSCFWEGRMGVTAGHSAAEQRANGQQIQGIPIGTEAEVFD